MRTTGADVAHMRPLIERCHLEGTARPRGGLFKDEGDILAFEALRLNAGIFGGFEIRCEPQHEMQFPPG